MYSLWSDPELDEIQQQVHHSVGDNSVRPPEAALLTSFSPFLKLV